MSPKLTVIGLNFAPEPTGIAPYTTFLAQHLADAGWTVKVVTGYPHYPQWKTYEGYSGRSCQETSGQVEVLRLNHYVPREPRLLNRLLMEVHFGIKAARANWGHPDIVLLVSPALISSGLVALVARLRYRRVRTAVWVQDLYSRGFEESHAFASKLALPMRLFESSVLSSADRTLLIHDRFLQHAHEKLGLAADQVEVIRNWSHIEAPDHRDRQGVRERFGWADEDVVVLHAGNMGLKQHLENVVEAAVLAEQRGSDVRFVLLGNGNQRRRLEKLGAGLSRLQFIDPVPDELYSATLSAADVLLVNEMPGVRDMAVPSKLTSYFVTGRPVLAAVESESATAGELDASGAGAVVPSGDPDALLTSAERLGEDSATASQLGRNGPRYATEHLSTAAAMQRWDTALRSLLPS